MADWYQDDTLSSTMKTHRSALRLCTVNPANEVGLIAHDCEDTIDEVYSSRLDPADMPLQNAELELFTVGTSFVQEAKQKSRHAITT